MHKQRPFNWVPPILLLLLVILLTSAFYPVMFAQGFNRSADLIQLKNNISVY